MEARDDGHAIAATRHECVRLFMDYCTFINERVVLECLKEVDHVVSNSNYIDCIMIRADNRDDLLRTLENMGSSKQILGPYKRKDGYTPLHLAVEEARMNSIHALLCSKADVNAASSSGYTPLHLACGARRMTSFLSMRRDLDERSLENVVKILVQSKANIDAKDIHRRTCLDWAKSWVNQMKCTTCKSARARTTKILDILCNSQRSSI